MRALLAQAVMQHTILNLIKEAATPLIIHQHQCISVLDWPHIISPAAAALPAVAAAKAGAADACLKAVDGGCRRTVAVLRHWLEGEAP